MQQQEDTSQDPYLEAAEGRIPRNQPWATDGVPRPDKPIGWLRVLSTWLGWLGADHFYLRSPITGLMKALTLGGFGLWWLWDTVQVWTEPERIALYGMTTPFDVFSGIGQGMIYDGKGAPVYSQQAGYLQWLMAKLFSFSGADAILEGAYGRLMRQIIETVAFALSAWGVVTNFRASNIFNGLFCLILAVFFGFMVVTHYYLELTAAVTPPNMLLTEGAFMNDKTKKGLNFYTDGIPKALFFLTEDEQNDISKHLEYGDSSPSKLKELFEIKHIDEIKAHTEDEQKPTSGDALKISPMASFCILYGILGICCCLLYYIPLWFLFLIVPVVLAAALAVQNIPPLSTWLSASLLVRQTARSAVSLPLPSLTQSGGSNSSNRSKAAALSNESVLIGVVITALAGGGALKAAIDYLMPQ